MTNLQGVDVASWQGAPGDWRAAAGRIGWAGVKLTELQPDGSRYVNPDAAADWEYLGANRLGRVAYAYGHPSVDAAASAAFLVAELTSLGYTDRDMVALDIEETDGKTPAEVAEWCRTFLGAVQKALSRLPIVYSYPYFIEQGNLAGCERFPLWISDPNHPAGHPVVPRPWKTWSIHQYGTSAPVDRDIIAYPSAEDMEHVLGKPAVRQPKPATPKTHPVKKVVKAAGHHVKTTVKTEPVLTVAAANGALAAAVAFLARRAGVHLTPDESKAVLTAIPAFLVVAAALRTRPAKVTVIAGALATLGTACVAFGLKVPVTYLGADIPFASIVAGLLVSLRVSPKTSPAPPVPVPVPPVPAVTPTVTVAIPPSVTVTAPVPIVMNGPAPPAAG